MASLRTALVSTLSKGKARLAPTVGSSLAPSTERIAAAFTTAGSSSRVTLASQPFSTTAVSSTSAGATSTSTASTPSPFASAPKSLTSVPAATPLSDALALLRSQPRHYVLASLVGRTYLLAPSDVFTLPRLGDVKVGDVLELDRIHEIGSRDFTLRAQPVLNSRDRGSVRFLRHVGGRPEERSVSAPHVVPSPGDVPVDTSSWASRLRPAGLAHTGSTLPTDAIKVRCVVVEHTKGRMERIVKKKRRKGYKKTIEHKQPYTRVRVEEIKIANQ